MAMITVGEILTKLANLTTDLERGGKEHVIRRNEAGQVTGSVERALDGDALAAEAWPLLEHLSYFLENDPPPDQAAQFRRAGLRFYNAAANAAAPDARASWAAGRDKWLPPS